MNQPDLSLEEGDRPPVQLPGVPRRGGRPERFALPLLLLALSTLFLCSVDKGGFYRSIEHGADTWKNLAIAENLSPDHGFRLFLQRLPGSGGAPEYDIYSRFPVGGYALIRLAILPFGNDLSARILAARMLMLLLFSAAALLAFHALARITSQRWTALAATLMAFSSYYMLFYGDMVSTESSMDLFAVMLVFHGMVVFVQEGRFRQLLAKTCVALLLGWHAYAFLLPFILLGLAREAMGAWKGGTAVWPRVRSTAAAVLRSRCAALGVAALLFGAAVLSFNFANEYAALGGETPVAELPSFQSMLMRTGLNQDFDPRRSLRFLQQEFIRACVASVPFVLPNWAIDLLGWSPSPGLSGLEASVYVLALLTVVGGSTTVVRLAGPLLSRQNRMLLAVLALSGFFLVLIMHYNVSVPTHDYEALFYVGVPLVFYSLLLLYVHKRWGHRPVVGFVSAALLAFVVSVFQMEQRWPRDARAAEIQQDALAELGAIRETTRGKVVLLLRSFEPEWPGRSGHIDVLKYGWGWIYYLAGSVLARSPDLEAAIRAADFVVTRDRVESSALLTPGNDRVFLYDSAGIDDLLELHRAAYRQAVSGDPVARSYFDVYLGDGVLTYLRDPCVREDVRHQKRYRIFIEVIPEDPKDVIRRHGRIRRHRWFGFPNPVSQGFVRHPVRFEGKCIAVLPLPDYPASSIRTGQDIYRHRGWEVTIPASR